MNLAAAASSRFPHKVTALAGGVGGARLAAGLAQVVPPENLTVIVNTGDDFEHLELKICPDLDTVCYTLAGVANPLTGWGRSNETWQAYETLGALGGPVWFRLGDRDLGLHLERTRRLHAGQPLSQVTRQICQAFGIAAQVLPMSDDPLPTWVHTDAGMLPFQDYFVRLQCQPYVTGFSFEGVERAAPAPGVLDAIHQAGVVIFCPSNPWVSLDPILAVPGIRAALQRRRCVAVSPIVGGKTIKGPAAKMFTELGFESSALAVASHYQDLLTGFVLDQIDQTLSGAVQALGMAVHVTDTIMNTPQKRASLAKEVIQFSLSLADKPVSGWTTEEESRPIAKHPPP